MVFGLTESQGETFLFQNSVIILQLSTCRLVGLIVLLTKFRFFFFF